MTSARKTTSRSEEFDFSEPIGTATAQICVRADDDCFEERDYAALNAKTIGQMLGNTRNQDLAKFAAQEGFVYRTKSYANEQELSEALQDGAVDAVITTSVRKGSNERVVAEFAEEPFYVMVRKGDTELLNEVNYGIGQDGYALYETVVEDTGIGISKEFLPHIFDQFERERNTTESGIQGTGLGMAIVKKNIDQLGGTVRIESELGKGTKVTVRLKYRIAPDAEKTSIPANAAEQKAEAVGGRILLVEDNDLNAEIAMELLKMSGCEVDRAENDKVCVEKLTQEEARHYNVVLMDIQMPVMNGYQATQAIRELEDPAKRDIIIVAMTANAFDEDKRKALDAGMDSFVVKPVSIDRLREVLAGLQSKNDSGMIR